MTERTATPETPRANAQIRAPIPLSARAVLTVDLAALRANWARLNEVSGRAECAGVLKADAYGLGLAPIARALTNEGCKTFFVATIDEGRTAREVQPGATVYVLDGLLPGADAHYAGFDLRPVLSSLAAVPLRTLGATSGYLAEAMGWTPFFLLTTAAALPGMALMLTLLGRFPPREDGEGQ